MEHARYDVDILDTEGNVIGQKRRSEIDKLHDRYNAVYIFLITPEGRVVLTPILERKDLPNIFVGQFGVPVATIRRSGESVEDAAHRAVARELFIDDAELHFMGEGMLHAQEKWDRLASVFYMVGEPPKIFSKTDLGELVTMTAREVTTEMKHSPDKFAPSLIAIWEQYQHQLPI